MAVQQFTYPTAAAMSVIEPELRSRMEGEREGLKLFPRVTKSTFFVRWTQPDNPYGMMQFRGLDGRPPKVDRVGANTFMYEPGVYGEKTEITERELTTRAIPGRPEITVPVDDLVMEGERLLLDRELTRMEYNIWTLLGTGTITVPLPGPSGGNVWTYTESIQTFTSTVPWSTAATATPLADLQTVQQKSVGHGVDFGASATLYANQVTANRLLNNANASDFGGRRNQAGATLNNIAAFNSYFAGQNLPQIKIVDDGFQPFKLSGLITNTTTQFIKFIPNGTAILVGKRSGNSPIGEWHNTINANNPGFAAGSYQFIKDTANGINAPKEVPPRIEINRGFNGGLSLYYANAFVSMNVG
jgi:hypothetical protein